MHQMPCTKTHTPHTNTVQTLKFVQQCERETKPHTLTQSHTHSHSPTHTHARSTVSVCLYGHIVAYSRRIIVSLVMNLTSNNILTNTETLLEKYQSQSFLGENYKNVLIFNYFKGKRFEKKLPNVLVTQSQNIQLNSNKRAFLSLQTHV